MPFSRRIFTKYALSSMGLLGVAGCFGKDEEPDSGKSFTMQAAWVNDAEFMGYFIAIDNGYYSSEGLDLSYLPGGPEVIPESTILSSRADLALTTPDTTANLVVNEGAKLKIIGAQYQKSPLGVVSLVASKIHQPTDLIGKTLAVPPVNILSVEAMLEINEIDKEAVHIVPYQYDPTPLLVGEVDATIDFVTNVPYTIELAGQQANSFLLYDYGFTIFNDTVVVTEETLALKRGEILAWLRASRKGWEENFTDPNLWPPKFEDTWFAGTGRTLANELYFNSAQIPLMESPNGLFSMSESDIDKNIKALAAIGINVDESLFDTSLLAEL